MEPNSPPHSPTAAAPPSVPDATGARVIVRVVDRSSAPHQTRLADPVQLLLDSELVLGREGAVPVGQDPFDTGISRSALVVTAATDGWHIRCTNRNGVALHSWAQAPSWLNNGSSVTLLWPRVGLRVVGTMRNVEHWVLLENDAYASVLGIASGQPDSEDTYVASRPRRLTLSQTTAAYAVFADFLAWPPTSTPAPRSLESVGQRLGITPSAIRERLKPLQERAQELGLHQQFGVTEPDYIFHLAAQGYLDILPPTAAAS